MVTSCAVSDCQNRQGRNPKSYYRFPSDPERRRLWTAALKKPFGWQPTNSCRVCSDHFISGKAKAHVKYPSSFFISSVTSFGCDHDNKSYYEKAYLYQ